MKVWGIFPKRFMWESVNICPNLVLKAVSSEHMWERWAEYVGQIGLCQLCLLNSSAGLIELDMALLMWLPPWLGLC